MKYEIGDKVILLQTDEEGTIVEFINDSMVMVDVKGVRFPVYTDQVDFPYFRMFTASKKPEKRKLFVDEVRKEKATARSPTHQGVFLSFLPVFSKDEFDDEVVEKLKLILVNQNAEDYLFTYEMQCGGEKRFVLKNEIRPAGDFYLHDIHFDEMSESPRFHFEFALPRMTKNRAPYFETELKIKAKQLFRKIEEARQKNEATFSFLLFKEYPDAAPDEKENIDLTPLVRNMSFDISAAARHLPPARSVVDLHIEKLSGNPALFSSAEILHMQLEAFEKYFDLARAHKLPHMTVIHGVGEGKLKNEIHERLRNRKGVKSFINRPHPLYGSGATEIHFDQVS